MFKVDVHPGVYPELEYSRKWYEDCASGLGNDFISEVDNAVETVREMPLVWAITDKSQEIRRYIIHRFPYCLIYRIQGSVIIIYAVMHLSRHPDYWRNRLNNW